MFFLQGQLSEAGIIATPLVEAERRRVAGISEHNGHEGLIWASYGHDRHAVIHWALERLTLCQQSRNVSLAVVAAVHGERGTALSNLQVGGAQFRKRLANQSDE